jgi:hypothetical protein
MKVIEFTIAAVCTVSTVALLTLAILVLTKGLGVW